MAMHMQMSNFADEIEIELLKAYGLPLCEEQGRVFLKTLMSSYLEQTYCIVDIETNGNDPYINQIIEIGAIKYKNGKIVDRFESFVYADFVPDYITKRTNITVDDLKKAPSLKQVLHDFRLFLGDLVFVAHNVGFDYNFISNSLKKAGFGELLNRKLCTIELAKKTIVAQKYGLGFLKEHLNIDIDTHHRAYADALSALMVFKEALKNIPPYIKTTEDLIRFSVGG